MNVKIENKKAFHIVAKKKAFTEENGLKGIPEFWEEYTEMKLNEKVCSNYGVLDTSVQNSKEKTYAIGCEQENVSEIPKDFEVINIPNHTWAVFKIKGAVPEAIKNKWNEIWDEWVHKTNYLVLNGYNIEYYPKGDKKSEVYESEIWIPIKPK